MAHQVSEPRPSAAIRRPPYPQLQICPLLNLFLDNGLTFLKSFALSLAYTLLS